MQIETKYNLTDWVYIMSENKVIKGEVISIGTRSEINTSRNIVTTITYGVTNYRFTAREDELFETKEALLQSL